MELYKKLNIDEIIYKDIVNRLGRMPNDFETYLFSAMHSEHCGYMHSKKYLKDFYTENNFEQENAGCIKIKDYGIFFKMESHNHPCAIEPYQGSMTGIGGIIRDVLSLGARPIALLNSLKFSKLKENETQYYLNEVVRGISDYGNSIGVPTISGETIFDEKFKGIPIVNVLALGIAKLDKIKLSLAKPNCLCVLLGSKTGVDGLNGANFASNIHDEKKNSRNSVQIGDPFAKKKLIEATLEINLLNEVIATQDLGASGILSSTSEMAYKGNCLIELYLDKVHTQIPDITPTEIMLSETQERMAFIVEEDGIEKIDKIAKKYELEYSIIGKTYEGSKYRVFNNNELLCDLDLKVLCEPYLFTLKKENQIFENQKEKTIEEIVNDDNFSSKEYIYSQFDSEVGGRTSFSSRENSFGILYLKEVDSFLALDCKTFVSDNAAKNTNNAFEYLYRKMIAAGFEPKGLTNCLNFSNPNAIKTQSEFLSAVKTLAQLSKKHKLPVVSGNVSFYNEKENNRILPTITLAFVGVQEDKKMILNSKISIKDKIYYLEKSTIEEEKRIIFDLIKRGLIKKAVAVDNLAETLLKQSLFYDLGFKIKTAQNIAYILITDKELDFNCLGEFIYDKIEIDKKIYDKEMIKNVRNSWFSFKK